MSNALAGGTVALAVAPEGTEQVAATQTLFSRAMVRLFSGWRQER